MQRSTTKTFRSYIFWLSVLLHLLLLLSFTLIIQSRSPEEQQQRAPNVYVPAYTYTGAVSPSVPLPQSQSRLAKAQNTRPSQPQAAKPPPEAKNGILPQQSMLLASYNVLQQVQSQSLRTTKSSEPIYLIGEDNNVSDPLVRLLGIALSAHFSYPKAAGEFGIRGKTLVGMILQPGGTFTDVQMLKSSNDSDLDAAALYAVNSAPLVKGANKYISKPKHFMVYFVFR